MSYYFGNRFLNFFFVNTLFVLWVLVTAITVIAIPKAGAETDLSAAQLLKLKKGQVLLVGHQTGTSSKGMIEASILINAPAKSIWAVIMDCKEVPDFIPGLKACQVLESGENWNIIRQELKLIWFWPRFTYVFRADFKKYDQIDFARISGAFKEMSGTWRFEPYANGRQTIVRYSVFIDPGFFVPRWLAKRSLMADLPASMMALRKKVIGRRLKP
jgi:ribosome-associated toxin RatA of RatAB toxin-antitoxin module